MNAVTYARTEIIPVPGDFSLEKTLDCGQVFRFRKIGGDDSAPVFELQAGDRAVRLCAAGQGELCRGENCGRGLIIENSGGVSFWRGYFDLDRDYLRLDLDITARGNGAVNRAAGYSRGIRILRQDRWEALCSFLISQNNNIPRIKKIIERLAERYGKPFETPFGTRYAFPTAEALCEAGKEGIFACGTGFRDKYIFDAAEKVANGLSLDALSSLPDGELAAELMKIKGVGPKVAACVMLYSYGRGKAVPRDVWIKRVEEKYGVDIDAFGENAGLVQQYLFYYERNSEK
ncbi:MAG: DNA glycosylase [Clostridia bacterium]|nr:DNA glycosylase [Clostridia bacterium]